MATGLVRPVVTALVGGRVIGPRTLDAETARAVLEPSGAKVAIVGGWGSGKTLAIEFLRGLASTPRPIQWLDDADPPLARLDVVYTRASAADVPDSAVLVLQPWGDDQIIEYGLARHGPAAKTVLPRVLGWADRAVLQGVPDLVAAVVDLVARGVTPASAEEALRHLLGQAVATDQARRESERWAVDAATGQRPIAPLGDAHTWRLLRHQAVRMLLAGDGLVRMLRASRPTLPTEPMPDALTRRVGRLAAVEPRVVAGLVKIVQRRTKKQANAASVLVTAGTGWRPQPTRKMFLEGAQLPGAEWQGVELPGAWARLANLSGARLDGATLTRACLDGADLTGACLARAKLCHAHLDSTQLAGSDLRGADLSGAVADRAKLSGATLDEARLEAAHLRLATLSGARLVRADLRRAEVEFATLEDADLSSANLDGASVVGVDLRTARLVGASLRKTRLTRCELGGQSMPGADLRGAALVTTDLTDCEMVNGTLAGARLVGCGLAGVVWEGADLRGVRFHGCTFHMGSSRSGLVFSTIASEGSRTGFYTDEFNEQDYRDPEQIRKANLCRADLRGANVRGLDFYLVDLRGAIYDESQRQWFQKCGAILRDR